MIITITMKEYDQLIQIKHIDQSIFVVVVYNDAIEQRKQASKQSHSVQQIYNTLPSMEMRAFMLKRNVEIVL